MDIRSARERADAILAAWNSRDYDKITGYLDTDVVLVDHTRGRTSEGPASYVDRFRRVLEACPDMKGQTVSAVADGNLLVQETEREGHHTVALDLPGGGTIPPTNQATSMHLVTIMEYEDNGRVKALRTYGNPRELVPAAHPVGVG